jgi:predicted nucleic acid-binding OB-fold protein
MPKESQKERLIDYARKTIGEHMGERTADLYVQYYKNKSPIEIRAGLIELLEEFLGRQQAKHYIKEIKRIAFVNRTNQ